MSKSLVEEKVVPFADWFDPNDIEHLRVFRHVSAGKAWPEGFLPENVELTSLWLVEGYHKLAYAWMDLKLGSG